MRAAFIRSYGNPLEVIEIGELDDPLLGPDAVAIEMVAAGVNPVDWKVVAGYLQRAFPHHLPLIPGWDVAGTVRAVGPAVTSVAVGDRVAAYDRQDHVQFGTFAELVVAPERAVALVPAGVRAGHAGALPLAGLTAEQLLDAAQVGAGDVVLVHNASGGVGGFAVQLAALRGATVIGTASPHNHERLAARGIRPVDYHGDLVASVRREAPDGVDVVIDLVGGRTLAASPQLLVPGGRLASVTDAKAMSMLAVAHGLRGQYVFVRPNAGMLARLLGLVADRKLLVDIDQTFPLSEAAAALEANRAGHTRGKIIIAAGDPEL